MRDREKMKKDKANKPHSKRNITPQAKTLFDRVVAILETARGQVVKTVNTQMVAAYWLIGREIVEALQKGEARAEYGARVIQDLSLRLTERYGAGFSPTNLKYFRVFFLAFSDRRPQISHPAGGQLSSGRISHPAGGQLTTDFHPALSWSHYRALMNIEKIEARTFYEQEAAINSWNKIQLERQINTLTYERLLMSKDKRGMLQKIRQEKKSTALTPLDVLKDPYILEFLNLPDVAQLHESHLEAAIINNLQSFLLELGKGFSFVARQKRMRFDNENFYIDLVFYNYLLRCFVLIDLKVGKLTHQDIGQMDSYVRMFDAHTRPADNNPTIGLILCSQKNEAVAKYSVLAENRRLFAAKYLPQLPTEDELRRELERERALIETRERSGAQLKQQFRRKG